MLVLFGAWLSGGVGSPHSDMAQGWGGRTWAVVSSHDPQCCAFPQIHGCRGGGDG